MNVSFWSRVCTRRQFLQSGLTGAALVALRPFSSAASTSPDRGGRIGALVDLTRCIGCRACERACDDRNGLPPRNPPTTVWDGPEETLTYNRWNVVNLRGGGDGKPVPVKRQCMHCFEPACTSVCPVGALHQLDSGAVIYRAERCVGCRYCILACPFGVPKFQWNSGLAPVIGKCQFCAQQPDSPGPACAAACPTGAIKFGRRDDLLAEAKLRTHARPDRYINHIYGEHEVGGTSWLYLSNRPFDELGFPARLPTTPLPALTRPAMHILPAVVTVLAVVLSAISYFAAPRTRSEGSDA